MKVLRNFMFGLTLFLLGCINHHFSNSDFVGVWQSDDGAKIIINNDGTCILSQLDNSIVSIIKDTSEKLNTKGTWKMVNNVHSGITGSTNTGIKITYNLQNKTGKGSIEFYISGQGFSENKPPWNLFIWKGDPDEMIKYKFVKQK